MKSTLNSYLQITLLLVLSCFSISHANAAVIEITRTADRNGSYIFSLEKDRLSFNFTFASDSPMNQVGIYLGPSITSENSTQVLDGSFSCNDFSDYVICDAKDFGNPLNFSGEILVNNGFQFDLTRGFFSDANFTFAAFSSSISSDLDYFETYQNVIASIIPIPVVQDPVNDASTPLTSLLFSASMIGLFSLRKARRDRKHR